MQHLGLYVSFGNDELSIVSLQSSTRNAATSFEFFLILFKTSGPSLVARSVSKREIEYCVVPGGISSALLVTVEQMEGKTKTTNADRCKRYREKNAEESNINGAFTKKRARLLLKSNKECTRKEREKKRLDKHRNNFATNHPYLDQE